MTAKSKEPYQFKIGEACVVRDAGRDNKIVDNGYVETIKPMGIVFRTLLGDGSGTFYFRRKGTEWVELKKDHFRLESP